MSHKAASGIKWLMKKHAPSCDNRADITDCACSWYTKYGGHLVHLAQWAKVQVDPHSIKAARKIHQRVLVAIDDKKFDPDGERPSAGSDTPLSAFLKEWKTHYADEHNLVSNSLDSMISVIKEGLGHYSLEALADGSTIIERWLNKTGKDRKWTPNTWNRYYELLSTICVRATKWKDGDKPRMAKNPMLFIEKRTGSKKKFDTRPLLEDIEDKLFAVVLQLNRVQHASTRKRLTQQQADAIRKAVKGGTLQSVVARLFGISQATCSQIIKGDIWNPNKFKMGTKGTEMERRLIGAFDGGLRAGEMMFVQIKHVEWTPLYVLAEDGTRTKVYRISLPAAITKGGKTTGEIEYIYAGTERFRRMLELRRMQLKRTEGEGFIFGTEDGKFQAGFRRMWRELFTLAGLQYGRDKGLVWHTTRHEFVSRQAEKTKNPVLTQELARHKDLKTTQGYFHNRRAEVLAAAVGMDRRK